MLKILMLTSLSLILSPVAPAHEGHGVPGAIQSQHGGVTKATDELYIELVSRGKVLMLYPTTHDSKPVPLKDVKVTATVKLPRSKKAEPLKFTPMSEADPSKSHFHGTYDAQGAHRYELEMILEYQGKKEKAVFQVESK